METKALSAVLHGINDIRVEDFHLRELKSDGDRVAVDLVNSCGKCSRCRGGHQNVCSHIGLSGFPPMHGGMARLTNIPACNAYKLPDNVDFEEGALTEPLAVCLQAVKRADVKAGDNVVIFGSGPIGLLMSQAALAQGATIVCVTDDKKSRLNLAREMGATHTVLFSQDETDARANAQKLKDALGEDIDITIDCRGQPLSLQTAVYATRSAGVVAIVGLGTSDASLPVMDATIREIDIRGCMCNIFDFPAAIKLMASTRVKVKPIITQRFRLEDVPQAFEQLKKRQVVKAMIQCSE